MAETPYEVPVLMRKAKENHVPSEGLNEFPPWEVEPHPAVAAIDDNLALRSLIGNSE